MKKRIFLAIGLMLFFTSIQAQSIERDVIASAGNSFSGGSFMADYSIGEAVISTLTSPGLILTQGFQQPGSIIISIAEPDANEMIIFCYPNPTNDFINVLIENPAAQSINIALFDLSGKLILEKRIATDGSTLMDKIDMRNYVQGTYFIRLSSDKYHYTSLTIIKLN